jgi:hypothetical protein
VAVTAADVGHRDTSLEPRQRAVERRQPVRHQVGPIAVAVEGRHPAVQAGVVLAPGDAGTGAKCREGLLLVEPHRRRHVPGRRQEHRAVLVGQHHRLFAGELVGLADGVVVDVAAGDLRVQPLSHVALGAPGARRELPGAERAGPRHRLVEAELAAQADHDAAVGARQVVDGAHDERIQLRCIDCRFVHAPIVVTDGVAQKSRDRPRSVRSCHNEAAPEAHER